MPLLPDAPFRDRRTSALRAGAEGHDAGHVGLEGERDDVVDGPHVFAQLVEADVAIELFRDRRLDLRPRRVEPALSPLRPHLHLANAREILLQPATVGRPQLPIEALGLLEHHVEDALLAIEPPPLGRDSILRLREQSVEGDCQVPLRGQAHAVGVDREAALGRQFERGIAGLLRRVAGHQLIDRDRVAHPIADLRPGQPDALAAVVMAEGVGMVESADRRDHLPVLLEHGQRLRQLVAAASLPDLPVPVVHAVGQIDEDTAGDPFSRLGGTGRGRDARRPRPHAFEHR